MPCKCKIVQVVIYSAVTLFVVFGVIPVAISMAWIASYESEAAASIWGASVMFKIMAFTIAPVMLSSLYRAWKTGVIDYWKAVCPYKPETS